MCSNRFRLLSFSTTALLLAILILSILPLPVLANGTWWNENWSCKKEITFDNTASAENLVDFPSGLSKGQVERLIPSLVRGGYIQYISGSRAEEE